MIYNCFAVLNTNKILWKIVVVTVRVKAFVLEMLDLDLLLNVGSTPTVHSIWLVIRLCSPRITDSLKQVILGICLSLSHDFNVSHSSLVLTILNVVSYIAVIPS